MTTKKQKSQNTNVVQSLDSLKHQHMLFERSPIATLMIRENQLELLNRAACQLWQVSDSKTIFHKPLKELFSENLCHWIEKSEHDFSDVYQGEIYLLDHQFIEVRISAIEFEDSLGKVIYLLITDLTQAKDCEFRHLQKERRLRELSHHIEEIRENERTQIAQEIHDELGSTLTVLKIDLYWLIKKLPTNISQECKDKTDTILDYVNQTIKTTRNLITELRPSILEHLGLKAALEWQVNKFNDQQKNIFCTLHITDEDIDLNSKSNITVFRIIQEALSNIIKHSKATVVSIDLRCESNHVLVVKIKDNGVGMSKKEMNELKRYGIQGMYERVYFCGGEISLFSEPNKGTIVLFKIPKTNAGERL
jgi:signal transduction histidine kinase